MGVVGLPPRPRELPVGVGEEEAEPRRRGLHDGEQRACRADLLERLAEVSPPRGPRLDPSAEGAVDEGVEVVRPLRDGGEGALAAGLDGVDLERVVAVVELDVEAPRLPQVLRHVPHQGHAVVGLEEDDLVGHGVEVRVDVEVDAVGRRAPPQQVLLAAEQVARAAVGGGAVGEEQVPGGGGLGLELVADAIAFGHVVADELDVAAAADEVVFRNGVRLLERRGEELLPGAATVGAVVHRLRPRVWLVEHLDRDEPGDRGADLQVRRDVPPQGLAIAWGVDARRHGPVAADVGVALILVDEGHVACLGVCLGVVRHRLSMRLRTPLPE